jgi:hypothetical protein
MELKENVMIFSDLESVLKGINNSSTMNSTSRITQTLEDKIDWNREGKNPIILDRRALWT